MWMQTCLQSRRSHPIPFTCTSHTRLCLSTHDTHVCVNSGEASLVQSPPSLLVLGLSKCDQTLKEQEDTYTKRALLTDREVTWMISPSVSTYAEVYVCVCVCTYVYVCVRVSTHHRMPGTTATSQRSSLNHELQHPHCHSNGSCWRCLSSIPNRSSGIYNAPTYLVGPTARGWDMGEGRED